MDKRKIGSFSQEVIELLELKINTGTPIYIGTSNIEHIKIRHPYEYEKYFPYISDIISTPNYVGKIPRMGQLLLLSFFK